MEPPVEYNLTRVYQNSGKAAAADTEEPPSRRHASLMMIAIYPAQEVVASFFVSDISFQNRNLLKNVAA
jgi:hypothetical protein